jgi:hypothetical protein
MDEGLALVDLSDPRAPAVLGALDLPDAEYAVDLDGGVAYVLEARGLGAFLSVLDVSDPADPQLLSRQLLSAPRSNGDLVADGRYLYVATTQAGLQVFDVLDPTAPLLVATLPTEDKAAGIALDGDRVAVATQSGNVLFADVRSPTQPVAYWEYAMNAEAVALAGDLLVVVDVNWTRLLDVSVPTSPAYLAPVAIRALEVATAPGRIHLGTAAGVTVVEVQDPRRPGVAAEIAMPAPVWGLAVTTDGLLAGDEAGNVSTLGIE